MGLVKALTGYTLQQQLEAAAKINRSSSPIAGKLWSGTPISNLIAPQVSAAENTVGNYGYYQPPAVNYSATTPTYNPSAPTQTSTLPSGGGAGSPSPNPINTSPQSPPNPNDPGDWQNQQIANQMRGDISSGWDSFISGLDEQLGQLPGQRSELETQAQNLYGTSETDVLGQKTLGLQDIGAARTKTEQEKEYSLKDVGQNLSNLMNAASNRLGVLGAGDSSATGRTAFALAKLGAKERANVLRQAQSVLQDLSQRESRLTEITNLEINKLKAGLNQNLTSIATWFNNARQALMNQKGEAGVSKSRDLAQLSQNLLNQATQMAMYYRQQYDSKQAALESWAMSNSQNINQLKTNWQSVMGQPIGSVSSSPIQGGNISMAQTTRSPMFGAGTFGTDEDQNRGMFG